MKEEATLKTLIENMSGEKKDLFKFPQITPNKLAEKMDHTNSSFELSEKLKLSNDSKSIKITYYSFK